MRHRLSSIAAMATLFAVAACSHSRPVRPHPVFSPNGEILSSGAKGQPNCADALGGWWDRIVAAHGGVLTRETLVADANQQFDAMDLDHDGFITPAELSEYRANLEEENAANALPPPETPNMGPTENRQARRQGRGAGAGGPSDSMIQPRVAAPQIPADVVDPVMSADKSLSFKVSREDFVAQANEIFTELDKDHDGKLTRLELVASCPEN